LEDSCTHPLYRSRPNLASKSRLLACTYRPNFVRIGLLGLSPLRGETHKFYRTFNVGISCWRRLACRDKVEHGYTTTNLPRLPMALPNDIKPLLSSNDFWAKSFSQTLPFKSVADRQTNNKLSISPRQRLCARCKRHQTWHGNRGPRARSCTFKTFSSLTHGLVSQLGDGENLEITGPPQI